MRIGINLGDVVVEGGDLLGDGVNIAARLEQLCRARRRAGLRHGLRPGPGQARVRFEIIGEQRLKNIARPVRAYGCARRGPRGGCDAQRPPSDKPSIAVLPFANMSGDPEQEYFGDGITEDIITELSRFRELIVIAAQLLVRVQGQGGDVRGSAASSASHYVVEGSVRRVGEARADHGPADRRRNGRAPVGRALRPGDGGHVRNPGRDRAEHCRHSGGNRCERTVRRGPDGSNRRIFGPMICTCEGTASRTTSTPETQDQERSLFEQARANRSHLRPGLLGPRLRPFQPVDR